MPCRSCSAPSIQQVLSLGYSPPSNAYVLEQDLAAPEQQLPLRISFCGSCYLVQTEDYTSASSLFTDSYSYFSGASATWVDHCRKFANDTVANLELGARSVVVELAANDGTLLKEFQELGVPCYGIEPTSSTATRARSFGLEVVGDFFGAKLGKSLAHEKGLADLIVANNVLAHVPNINDFVTGIKNLLAPDGVCSIEVPSVVNLVRSGQFDTIYHEHFSYFSLASAEIVFERSGLTVFDVEEIPTHGGSLRFWVSHEESSWSRRDSVEQMLEAERSFGIHDWRTYAALELAAIESKVELLNFLLDHKKAGRLVAAYGAAAKGNTRLNFAGVGPSLITFVCDAEAEKQGKYLPGSLIPILPPEELFVLRPDVVLILPWNLRDEIRLALEPLRSRGTRLFVCSPNIEELL